MNIELFHLALHSVGGGLAVSVGFMKVLSNAYLLCFLVTATVTIRYSPFTDL